MAFDWISFLNNQRVEWSTHGASKGNITISCPFCGSADQSTHLAVSLNGRGWRCFRNRNHAGRSVPFLIQALLKCSWSEAQRLAGVRSTSFHANEDIGDTLIKLVSNPRAAGNGAAIPNTWLQFLPAFRPLLNRSGTYIFAVYLNGRGYEYDEVDILQANYHLMCTAQGPFQWRVIFPVIMDGKLVTWTGRHISKNAGLRYRTLSANPETAEESGLPVALRSIEQTLWNWDHLTEGGYELLICEGPFDAMRLDFFGQRYGIRATCTYTKSFSDAQITLLEDLHDKYEKITRVLDADAQLDLLGEQRRCGHLDLGWRSLPAGFADPAELDRDTAMQFMGI